MRSLREGRGQGWQQTGGAVVGLVQVRNMFEHLGGAPVGEGFCRLGEWPRAQGGSAMEGLRLCFCMAVLFLRVQQQYAAKGAFADL